MSKKFWKIVCVISFVLFVLSAVPLIPVILQIPNRPEMGIIGGADSFTYSFIIEKLLFHHPLFYIGLICFAVFIVCLVILFVKSICKR